MKNTHSKSIFQQPMFSMGEKLLSTDQVLLSANEDPSGVNELRYELSRLPIGGNYDYSIGLVDCGTAIFPHFVTIRRIA